MSIKNMNYNFVKIKLVINLFFIWNWHSMTYLLNILESTLNFMIIKGAIGSHFYNHKYVKHTNLCQLL